MFRTFPGLLAAAALVSLPLVACGSSSTSTRSFDAPTDPNGTDTDGDGTPDAPSEASPVSNGNTPPPQPGRTGCTGTSYTEALPVSSGSLTALSFSQAKAGDYLLGALAVRYPLGKYIVDGGLAHPIQGQAGTCIDRFLQDKSSASRVLQQASTVVHECGHFFDLGKASGSAATYVIRDDLELTCKSGDTTSRGGKTFARSLIKGDDYYASRKACGNQVRQGCDMYADIYLTGSPTDSTFDSGDQGYNSLLEEATQYVNSLASALAFYDQYQGTKVTERDGIMTFLWYMERYLKLARESYPQAYATLSQDSCWRQATLSVWDRGWFYLNATKGKDSIQIDADAIEELVRTPELVAEIDALRNLECK